MWMIQGSPRTPDRLPELFGSHVQQSGVFRTITGARGPYNLGGSTTFCLQIELFIWCTHKPHNSDSLLGDLGNPESPQFTTHTGSTWSYHNITMVGTKITYIRVRKIYNISLQNMFKSNLT